MTVQRWATGRSPHHDFSQKIAEIARELVVSVNTVRTQVQSIYNKLGVHSRSAASEVARELRLIS